MHLGEWEGLVVVLFPLFPSHLSSAAGTAGCLDMGGGSAQIAFEVPPERQKDLDLKFVPPPFTAALFFFMLLLLLFTEVPSRP